MMDLTPPGMDDIKKPNCIEEKLLELLEKQAKVISDFVNEKLKNINDLDIKKIEKISKEIQKIEENQKQIKENLQHNKIDNFCNINIDILIANFRDSLNKIEDDL